MSEPERFWSKVEKGPECWLWFGAKTSAGYGNFRTDDGRYVTAHRWAAEAGGMTVPSGMYVCHVCDTPLCVRPDHLFVGTPSDNQNDMVRKGRQRGGSPVLTSCRRGHVLDAANLMVSKKGKRYCRACIAYRLARRKVEQK